MALHLPCEAKYYYRSVSRDELSCKLCQTLSGFVLGGLEFIQTHGEALHRLLMTAWQQTSTLSLGITKTFCLWSLPAILVPKTLTRLSHPPQQPRTASALVILLFPVTNSYALCSSASALKVRVFQHSQCLVGSKCSDAKLLFAEAEKYPRLQALYRMTQCISLQNTLLPRDVQDNLCNFLLPDTCSLTLQVQH